MNATTARLYRKYSKEIGKDPETKEGRKFYRHLKREHAKSNVTMKVVALQGIRETLAR